MFINLIADDSVSSAPSGFTAAVQAAANLFDSTFSDNITVNIRYGWGTLNNSANPNLENKGGALAQTLAGNSNISYSTLKSWLSSSASALPGGYQAAAVSSLPASNSAFPNSANSFFVSSALEKALGHFSGAGSALDGAIGFGTLTNPAKWEGIALHEIAHALGRTTGFPYEGNVPTIMDLFRYDAAGHFQWTAGQPAYLSIDAGQTALADFSTTGDFGDFVDNSLTPNDPFDLNASGNALTETDVELMDVLGFHSAAPMVVNDNPLSISPGATLKITRPFLAVTSPAGVFPDSALVYTLVTTPSDGALLKNGVATTSFTQDDIDNSQIAYQETASNFTSDSFALNISDPAGNHTGNASFQIKLAAVPYDLNGDRTSDLVFQNNGQAGVWLMNGATPIAEAGLGNPGPSWHIVASRDLNGDGKADLIWQDTDGTGGIWLMNGTTPIAELGFASPGATWHIVAAGDFNGDGMADLMWQNSDGTLGVWLMNGTAPMAEAGLGNPGANWKVIGTADYNADGEDDILLQNTTTGNLTIDLMNGSSVTSSVSIAVGDPSWHAVSTGVFNGTPEIAWQNSNGTPAIWLMNGTTPVAQAGLPNPGTAWQVVSVDHFAPNGQAGLLFQNTNGGMGLWQMNGTNIVAETGLLSPDSGWQSVNGHPFASG